MAEVIRKLLDLWIVRRTSPDELRRAKLEALAREFVTSANGTTAEQKIRDAFRLGRVWLSELDNLKGEA